MRNIRKSEKSFKKHNIPQPNLSLNPIYNNLSLHYLGLNEKDKIKPK